MSGGWVVTVRDMLSKEVRLAALDEDSRASFSELQDNDGPPAGMLYVTSTLMAHMVPLGEVAFRWFVSEVARHARPEREVRPLPITARCPGCGDRGDVEHVAACCAMKMDLRPGGGVASRRGIRAGRGQDSGRAAWRGRRREARRGD